MKTMDPEEFKLCIYFWLQEGEPGYDYRQDIQLSEDLRIKSFWIMIKTITLTHPGIQAVKMLDDLRNIEANFGLEGTFSYDI